ncbi:MAG: pyruvate ferredoxin oxidoreductase [Proteobacteria bacterium]|nr:pyruvate ferredoxin oxidoreductase [Pseudomonadota bacterium]NIS70876.1 pyruvate ferredoxin oxidoreductase [Pseudomonadota bacterium]
MENLNVYAVRLLTQKEYFAPGHRSCQGCAEALAVRLIAKALGRNAIVVQATGCMEIVASPLPFTSWEVPWIHVAFETAASVASGIEAGLKALMRKGRLPKKRVTVLGMGGDGATNDIGIMALSGALERGHDFVYICTDNEAYMNTGIQRSSGTPFGASTTTSPAGRVIPGQITWKKNMAAIAAAHNIPYVATACPSYPLDLVDKVKKAAGTKGPAYVHILSVCPTGWRSPTEMSIRLGRLAAETGVFPLYEIVNGRYRLTIDFPKLRPIRDYFKYQGRFRHLTDEMTEQIEERVHREYQALKDKCQ